VISGTPTAIEVANFTARVSGGAQSATQPFSITITPPGAPVSAWPDATVPGSFAGADAPVELGVKFRSDVAGYVTSIRFYKFAGNTGTHVGNLWSSTGTPLATATFTNETVSGWQRVDFSQPVAIGANTTYVASYHCPNGFYSFDYDYFATQGVDVPPLHLLASNVSGGNGVFQYAATSAFPASTYRTSNYWVDVVFSAPPPLQSIAVTPATPTVTLGATQSFTAIGTYFGGGTQDLTNQVSWASSTPAVATVSTAGLATTLGAGGSIISATLGAVSGSASLTVSLPAPLVVTTTTLPSGALDAAYTATLAASGGTPPYTWSIANGQLPAGLTVEPSTGVISGTPTAGGVSNFTVGVSAGAQSATQVSSIAILTGYACSDGLDNDGDALVDFPADPGCIAAASNLENPLCDDDLDNDGDGKIDWDGGAGLGTPDPECTAAFRNRELPNASSCGLGTELVIALPLLAALRRRTRRI
jgi:hypothetical protein